MIKRKQIREFTPKESYDEAETGAVKHLDPEDNLENGQLITSLVSGKDQIHAPVLDIDMAAEVYPRPGLEIYPSSQLGHYHLYINKEMPQEDYFKLLTVLADVGIIEPGYADVSKNKGYSTVRNIGVVKPSVNITVAKVLIENAQLKKQVYTLTSRLNALHCLISDKISNPKVMAIAKQLVKGSNEKKEEEEPF
jgi:hypothetical protein